MSFKIQCFKDLKVSNPSTDIMKYSFKKFTDSDNFLFEVAHEYASKHPTM